ncbi:MAG: response regulator [Candidatus Limivivens sp.]|nr:response regulator [Candidatus Limivivens sp.]
MLNLVVIDDEKIVVEWVKTVIERSGTEYQVVGSAGNGIRGLAVVRQKKPDIVITDIRIPGLDGLSLIEQTAAELPQTAFIVISGYQDFEYAKRALELQVLDYIDKPLNQEKLFGALKRAAENVAQKRKFHFLLDNQQEDIQESARICRKISEEFSLILEKESADTVLLFLEGALEEIENTGISLEHYKDECAKNIYLAMEALQERTHGINLSRNAVPYAEVRQLHSFEEVRLYTLETIRDLSSAIRVPKKSPKSRDIKVLLDYIDTHYTQDIGLSELAELVNMSPANLSIFFKEQVGMSYIKYLTRIRIDRAKDLLRSGEKASDIGEMVGYNDYRYFSQVFKKLEHMTPSEYRDCIVNTSKKS